MLQNVQKLILIHNFGRSSMRPYRTAKLRVLLVCLAVTILGCILGQVIFHTILPKDLPIGWLAIVVSFLCFGLFGIMFFIVNSTQQSDLRGDQLLKVSTVLPLSRMYRWFIISGPIMIIWLQLLMFTTPIVLGLSHATGHNFWVLLMSAIVGSFLAFGFIITKVPGGMAVKISMFCIGIVASSSYTVHIINQFSLKQAVFMIMMEVMLAIVLVIRHYSTFESMQYFRKIGTPFITLRSVWLRFFWFGLKILRNRRAAGSLLFTLLISIALAVGIQYRNLAGTNGYGWLLLSGVMTAAFASDIRGITRKHKTVEIVTLKGQWHFIDREVIAIYAAGLLSGLPLLTVVLLNITTGHFLAVCYFITLQFGAGLMGLLASTIVVPGNGDTGSQFIASITSVSSIFIIPKITHMADMPIPSQIIGWVITGIIGYAAIAYIEQLRRRQYGYA